MKRYQNKKVVVTGATGLIGSNLVIKLLNEGADVIAVGRSRKRLINSFLNLNPDIKKHLTLIESDISHSFPDIKKDVDYIFHAASPISGKLIKQNPVEVILPNLCGILNCLNYLKNNKSINNTITRLVVFSSATVYGNRLHEKDLSIGEESTEYADSLDSVNSPYSESKRMIEVLAKSYSKEFGIDAVIGRISYVYGTSKNMPDTAFYEFITNALNGKNIELNSSVFPKRDNIFVDDAVEGLLTICKNGSSGESYNISSNGEKNNFAAIDEIAKVIVKKSSFNISVVYKKSHLNTRNPGLRLDNKKLRNLGWSIKIDLEEGISRVLDFYSKLKTK